MKNRFIFVIVISALLAACAPKTAAEPTLDIGAIQTWAVETAVMEITVQSILHPSSTPIPETANSLLLFPQIPLYQFRLPAELAGTAAEVRADLAAPQELRSQLAPRMCISVNM